MNSNTPHSFTRVLLQAIIALVMVFSAAASVTTAFAATPPANDDFEDATKITVNTYSAGVSDMTAATMEGIEPPLTCDGGNPGEASLWFTFQPSQSGQVSINTKYSGYDTVVTVFKAAYDLGAIVPPDPAPVDPFSLIEVGCNDDASGIDKTSSMLLPVRGGIRYYIEVVRKTGTAVSAPDALKMGFQFVTRVPANPNFYDVTDMPVYFAPKGWQIINLLPGVAYMGNVVVGNNPGDTTTVYFEGESVQICYALGPVFGNMDVYIDDVLIATLAQGNATYQYAPCWDSSTMVFLPVPGATNLLYDNLHKLTLKNAGPSGYKVNLDTIQVFPLFDFDPPASITDLAATVNTAGNVTLTWSATGDDSLFGSTWSYGKVHHNEIRYRLTPFAVFPNDWDTASIYSQTATTPLPSGSKQTLPITGLIAGQTYYFMVVGVDESGNYGDPAMSSFASATPTTSSAYGVGFYDDRHVGWKYTGMWKALTSSDSLANTLHQANQLGSTATFKFSGTQFRLYYWATANQGLMDVMLDGVLLTTIDENKLVLPGSRRIYASPILVNGPHTVQLIQKSVPYINIDGIGIHNLSDGGVPDPIVDLLAVPGPNPLDGSVDLSWTAMGDDPGSVGTAASYEVRYSSSPILTLEDWEAALPASGVIALPQAAGNLETMTVIGLVPGVPYWFAVRATDDAGYSNISNTATSTAAVWTVGYMPAGYYEDTDFNWLYYGIWTLGYPLPASNSDQHSCSLSGSSAAFLFSGDGFTLYYQTKSGFSGLKVYVDGVYIGTINQKLAATLYQQDYTFSGFGAANHVVQFVCTGKATIDAIEILP